jgi:hypothetical protein
MKNRTCRALSLDGDVRAIIERRLKARRRDCPFTFHRVMKGRPGRPIRDIYPVWKQALAKARLLEGRLFHDLRRSAVRTLIRAGVDRSWKVGTQDRVDAQGLRHRDRGRVGGGAG